MKELGFKYKIEVLTLRSILLNNYHLTFAVSFQLDTLVIK